MRALDLHEISVGYGDRRVIHSLSFGIADRRTTALVGPGGSGKSTLLRLVGGARYGLYPDLWSTGAVYRNASSGSIAVLPQKLCPPWGALHEAFARCIGDRDPERWLRALWGSVASGAFAALADSLDAPAAELPPSLWRLAAFTIAIGGGERILLLDEPEQGADELVRGFIGDMLEYLRGQKTILMVTHNLQYVTEVADDMIFLLDGDIVEMGATGRVLSAPRSPRTRDFITMGG